MAFPNPIFVCSGANTTTQTAISADVVDVLTAPGFSVDTTASGGIALDIGGSGRVSYRDFLASPLTSPDTALRVTSTGDAAFIGSVAVETNGAVSGRVGVLASNAGSGAVSVTTTGSVLATGGPGIQATNSAAGTDVTINAAAVTAPGTGVGSYGIFVQNDGRGATSITATGTVSSGGTGVFAMTAASGTNVTVNVGNVSGRQRAVAVLNSGTGDTAITSTGDLVGTLAEGIVARNDATAGSLRVEVANVQAGATAMAIQNGGRGATTVIANGTVVGAAGTGMSIISDLNTAGTIVLARAVTGGQDGINILNNGVFGTVVAATGAVVGTNGTGILVENNAHGLGGGVSVDAASVTGGVDGIRVVNNGLGALFEARTGIAATGDVIGGSGVGIAVDNGATTTDLSIRAVNVTGGSHGIAALNNGTGETSVTATGRVAGGGALGAGILATNGASATNLTVNAADTTGGFWGISAINTGIGATRVTSTGTAASTTAGGVGLSAVNTATATDLTVEAVNVTGWDGLRAGNSGSGATIVTVTGDIVGAQGNFGLVATNASSATDLTIRVANVRHQRLQAVSVVNEGTGTTSITATGTVVGGGSAGIFARNGTTATGLRVDAVDVTGAIDGVTVINQGTGESRVVTTGTVTGTTDTGISVANDVNTTNLTVGAVNVTGGVQGIVAGNRGTGATIITVTGRVSGGVAGISGQNAATATNLTVEAVDVTGGQRGIAAVNFGTGATRVTSTGGVASTAAGGTGIFVRNGATATDLVIEAVNAGGSDGIFAENTGTGRTTITATGSIAGTDGNFGLSARNGAGATDLAVNVANVSHDRLTAVSVVNDGIGVTRIAATGRVVGGGANGIFARNGATASSLTVEAVDVSGRTFGIQASNAGSGATIVTATGMVAATNGTGLLANHMGGPAGLMIGVASVSGGTNGIDARNTGGGGTRVTVAGDVVAGSGAGLSVSTGGPATDVTINAVNVASGGSFGISSFNGGSGMTSIIATGTVTSATGTGIAARNIAFGTDLAINAATVGGGVTGIRAVNEGTGATRVAATGNVAGTSAYGILAVNGGVTLAADGSIAAISGNNGTSLTVQAAGASGGISGIYAYNTGSGVTSATATGLVRGNNGDGLFVRNTAAGTDVMVSAAAVSGTQNGIQALNNGTGSTSVTATELVEGAGSNGIVATNAVTTANLTVQAASAQGGTGINALNLGTGATAVMATGNVVGTAQYGIQAQNAAAGTTMTVTATNVSGAITGIAALTLGSGANAVTSTGTAAGTSAYGILAVNGTATLGAGGIVSGVAGSNGTDLTVNAFGATGGLVGIYAYNTGSGLTSVTATGDVVGTTQYGLQVANAATGTTMTVNAANTSGAVSGIAAFNAGTGAASVISTGSAVGISAYGILAANGTVTLDAGGGVTGVAGSNGTDLTISAAGGTGGLAGIYAYNTGSGLTSVTSTGLVRGSNGDGLFVRNAAAGTDVTVNAASVSGTQNGIQALNYGNGATLVTANGPVEGAAAMGILAGNMAATATGVTVQATSVSGGQAGIGVLNAGSGALAVTATGTVVGAATYGILAVNGTAALSPTGVLTGVMGNNGTTLAVTAASASGGLSGIYAANTGTGATVVKVSGVVQGGTNAIFATANGQAVDLQFAATADVRNTTLSPSALAVSALGSSVALINDGTLIGAVQLTGLNNQVTNRGTWSAAGAVNILGGPASQLVNGATGTIVLASSAGTLEMTQFQGGAHVFNRGLITLRDGGAGDVARFGGNMIMTATSVQAIDLGGGTADKIVVDGAANLSGTLVVSKTGGTYQLGGRYTVLTAMGGIVGRYSAVTGDVGQLSAFISVVDTYDANNAYLEVAQQRPFTAAAFTPNQWAAAGGAQSLPIGNPLFNAIATLQTDAQARLAFDQISGEAHASGRTALNEGSRLVRDAALGRLRNAFGGPTLAPAPATAEVGSAAEACAAETCQAEGTGPVAPSRYAVWAQGLGSWGSTDGNGNAAGLFRTNAGFLVGADAQVFEVARLGLFGGYTRTTFNVADRQSSGGSDNAHLGLYGGAQFGPVGVRLGAAYSWHTLSARRGVAFPGFADTLRSDYAARTVQVFGELGYRIPLDKVTLEPFANLAYSNLTTDGFTEKGGAAALTVASSSTNVTTTTLGLRTAYSFQLGDAPSQVRGMLGWQHAFGDVTPLANMVLNGGSPFTVSGIPIARDSALIEAGFDVRLSERISLGATYTGQFASGVQDQTVRANITFNF